MTTPALSVATDLGRLYRRPEADPAALSNVTQAVRSGLLVPSVTNVIDVLNKPFLATWHAKEVALAAVDVHQSHPGLIESKPTKAVDYLKKAATRKAEAAAALGDEVHNAVEALAAGQPVEVSDAALPFLDSWRAFVADFAPEFLHLEASCFGQVISGDAKLGYAGTADAIIRVAGKTYVVDYKTGKSIHTEAALQLSALAHASDIVTEEGTAPMPAIDAGAVIHLTANGYSFRPVDITDNTWNVFSSLRTVWDFHARNLASRAPLFVSPAMKPAVA